MKTKKSVVVLLWVLAVVLPMTSSLAQEIPVTTNSKEAKKMFLMGREKLENYQLITGAELLDKAISLDPGFALAHIYRAQAGGLTAGIREHREKAVSLSKDVSEGERYLIMYMEASADNDEARREEYITKLLSLYPKDKRVHLLNAYYLSSRKNEAGSIEAMNKAIQLDKNFYPAYNVLGYAYMAQKNWAESDKAFKKYIELQPNNPNPYDSYADMLLKSGKLDEALTNFKKAYSLDPTFISTLARIGLVYIHKGQFEKARESYRELYEKAPDYNWKVAALLNEGQSYLHEGNFNEAVKKYEQAKAFASSQKQYNSMIHITEELAWMRMENGDLIGAAHALKEASALTQSSDITNSNRQTHKLIRCFGRSEMLMSINEFESAETQLAECRKIIEERKNPFEEGDYYTLLGMLERSKGNYDKALTAFSKSNPDDPYAWYQKALAYEGMGDRDAAMKTYKEVINYNFGGLPYALVRNKAKQKLETALVVN